MDVFQLPPAESIPQLGPHESERILDVLFEHSDELSSAFLPTLQTTVFLNYDAIIAYVKEKLLAMSAGDAKEQVDAILSAHPRLGEKKVESAQSKAEQAHLQNADPKESETLDALNREYETAFNGLKYVTFVNGRPRSEIFTDMRMRIQRNDIAQEREDGIIAICEIAQDRARKLGPRVS